jgi:tetratricopeptide (TPR) repeat protein
LGESAAQKALMLDDTLAEAYAVLGEMARFDRKWAKAKDYHLHAIASEPKNSTAHLWYGEHLYSVGRIRDALEELLIAYQLDPLHPGTNNMLAKSFLSLGDTSNALKYGAAASELEGEYGLYVQAEANWRVGEFERAMEFAEQFGDSPYEVVSKLLIEAKIDAAKRPLFFETVAENESAFGLGTLLWFYAAFERIDDAYRMLKLAPDSMNGFDWDEMWVGNLAAFRQDPRFAELATEQGLVDYWREHGWPDACQPAGDSVICE